MIYDHKTISIADQIFDNLEKDILSGRYKRGDVLSEVKLSEELGVSRTPVREALRRLEQERILADSSKGSVVIGISSSDMLDLYDIRIQLEGQAAARAAKNITEEQLNEMQEILDLQKFYIDKGGNEATKSENVKDMDSRFHELIYLATGSVTYYDILSGIHRKITKYRKASVSEKSRAQHSYEEHRAIFEAIRAGEAELARTCATSHIINARDNIKAKILAAESENA